MASRKAGGPPLQVVRPASEKSPEKTLDFYVKARDGRKRDYIFGVDKMRRCQHNHLEVVVEGWHWYTCPACNWAFEIPAVKAMPLHQLMRAGVLGALYFGKRFGSQAVQEVLRTPAGQHKLDYHLPVLPEGHDISEAMKLLDDVDTHAPDGGKAQMFAIFNKFWVSPAEKERRHKELSFNPELVKKLEEKGLLAALEGEDHVDSGKFGTIEGKPQLGARHPVSSLPGGKGKSPQDRHKRGPD